MIHSPRNTPAAAATCALLAVLLSSGTVFAQDAPPAEPAEPAAPTQPAEPEAEKPAEPQAEKPAEKPAAKPAEAPKQSDLTPAQFAEYEVHLRAGKAAYANQNFELALSELQKAYDIHNKPSILFNLALISEKSGSLERSVGYYQQFLEAPGVTLENRKRASERLAAIQQILATSESSEDAASKSQMTDLMPALEAMGIESVAATDTQTTKTTAQTGTTGTTGTTGSTDTGAATDTDLTVKAEPEVEYRWPVYAAFGTATAALVGGVVMVGMTNKAIDDGKEAGQAGDNAGLAAAEERASMYATTSAGLFIGGAALAVVGSYFVVRTSVKAEEEAARKNDETTASLGFSFHKNFVGPILNVKF